MLQVHCDAVATLSPQVRKAYLLRKVHGLSHKEIAAHEGIAVSTVEKHLMKATEVCERYVRERAEGPVQALPMHVLRKVAEGRR